MKKIWIVAMAALITVGVAYFALAEEPMGKMMGKEMMPKPMMGKGMPGACPMMCPMHTMMAKCMMHKEMVATEEGGVIVMMGNKLMKYDKDLNMVKEVEMQIDMEAIQKKMQEMQKECMEKCQMMKEKASGEKM